MKSKVIIITGATSGIGKATAMGIAKMDYEIMIVARNKIKAERVRDEITNETGNSNIEIIIGDLSSINDCDTIIDQIKSKYDKIDVLINNAAILPKKRTMCNASISEATAGMEVTMVTSLSLART